MFRKNKPFEATKGAPFKNDKLGREENIFNLDKIMRDVKTPLVMTVSASWGSGKSSFVRMWKAYLEKERHPCILFNAWEHDFTHQPFLDFMGEIYEYMDTHNGGKKNVFNGAKKRFKKHLPLATALCGVGSAIAKAVPCGQIPGVFLEAGEKAGQATLAGICKEHTDLKKLLDEFKKQDFPNFLKKSQLPSGGNNPFYFFVDELDRCEPSYAIALLETINHIFDVEGIVFVLAVDKEKLGSMAKTRYGSAFDADGYLERFIDVEYSIPDPKTNDFIAYLIKETYNYFNNQHIKNNPTLFIGLINQIIKPFDLSLRDIETTFCRSQLLFSKYESEVEVCSLEKNDYSDTLKFEIYITMAFMHSLYKEDYYDMMHNKTNIYTKKNAIMLKIENYILDAILFGMAPDINFKRIEHTKQKELEQFLYDSYMRRKELKRDNIIKEADMYLNFLQF